MCCSVQNRSCNSIMGSLYHWQCIANSKPDIMVQVNCNPCSISCSICGCRHQSECYKILEYSRCSRSSLGNSSPRIVFFSVDCAFGMCAHRRTRGKRLHSIRHFNCMIQLHLVFVWGLLRMCLLKIEFKTIGIELSTYEIELVHSVMKYCLIWRCNLLYHNLRLLKLNIEQLRMIHAHTHTPSHTRSESRTRTGELCCVCGVVTPFSRCANVSGIW